MGWIIRGRIVQETLLDANICKISDDKGMAELLNGFFSSVVFTREDLQDQPTAEDL
jgi:hypothetical protein